MVDDLSEHARPDPERIEALGRAIQWVNGLKESPPGGINQELFGDIVSHLAGTLEHAEHIRGGESGDKFALTRRDGTVDVIDISFKHGQEEKNVDLLEWTHLTPSHDDKCYGYGLILLDEWRNPEKPDSIRIEDYENVTLDDAFNVTFYGGAESMWKFMQDGTIEHSEADDDINGVDPEIVGIEDVPLESFLPPKN